MSLWFPLKEAYQRQTRIWRWAKTHTHTPFYHPLNLRPVLFRDIYLEMILCNKLHQFVQSMADVHRLLNGCWWYRLSFHHDHFRQLRLWRRRLWQLCWRAAPSLRRPDPSNGLRTTRDKNVSRLTNVSHNAWNFRWVHIMSLKQKIKNTNIIFCHRTPRALSETQTNIVL